MRVLQAEHRLHAAESEPKTLQLGGVDLDAHRRRTAALHAHLPDALNLRELLLEDGGGKIVELCHLVFVGGEADDHDGRISRIDLTIGRVGWQIRRQIGTRGINGRLHVSRRTVDVAAEIELHGHVGRAERTRRSHLSDACDVAELAFERRGDRSRHNLRARAGQSGGNADGREIHLRQRGYRQHHERDCSGNGDSNGEQRSAHGPPDEWGRKVHAFSSPAWASSTEGSRERCRPLTRSARRSKKM